MLLRVHPPALPTLRHLRLARARALLPVRQSCRRMRTLLNTRLNSRILTAPIPRSTTAARRMTPLSGWVHARRQVQPSTTCSRPSSRARMSPVQAPSSSKTASDGSCHCNSIPRVQQHSQTPRRPCRHCLSAEPRARIRVMRLPSFSTAPLSRLHDLMSPSWAVRPRSRETSLRRKQMTLPLS